MLLAMYRCGKTPCPDFMRWWEGPKQRFIIKQLYAGHVFLVCHVPSKWVWPRVEIKQNQALHQISAGQWGFKKATYKKTWFTHRHLILKRIAEAAEIISQQHGIFEHTSQPLLSRHQLRTEVDGHTSEYLVSIGNKLQLFFRILQWFCLISNLSQIHSNDPWHFRNACQDISCLTINLCFGPFNLLTKFGLEVFPVYNVSLSVPSSCKTVNIWKTDGLPVLIQKWPKFHFQPINYPSS